MRYYEARALIFEIYDYFNLIDKNESEKLIEQSKTLINSDFRHSISADLPKEERGLLKTKVRFACAGINEIYKKRDYQDAERLMSILYNFVHEVLVKEDDPCWGTLGLLAYIQGKIFRGLAKYQLASQKYAESCEAYHRRALCKRDDENIKFSKWKSGISLGLGIGFTDLTRGYIDRAMNSLIPARTLLLDCGGEFYQTYLDFLIASAKRAYSGNSNRNLLEKAIELLLECEIKFNEEHHEEKYRAGLELAIAFYHFGDYPACKRKLLDVETYATKENNKKLLERCLIASSHLARKQGHNAEAERVAEEAIKRAEGFREVSSEALLALAQVQADSKNYGDAYHTVEKARRLIHSPEETEGDLFPINFKILAMCYLTSTHICLAMHKLAEAEEDFQQWKKIKPTIKHQFTHDFANLIEEGIENLQKPFVIEPYEIFLKDGNRKYDFFRRLLQQWLVKQVERKTTEVKAIAETLGVSRTIIYDWKKDERVSKKN